MFTGKLLENDKTLEDYSISKEYTLNLTTRLTGGGFVWSEATISENIKNFCKRLNEYKGFFEDEKLDIEYYLGQSWHEGAKWVDEVFEVKFWIDNKLDDEWIKIINKDLKTIMKFAPGLKLDSETFSELNKSKLPYQVIWTANNDNEAYTKGNIFNSKIKFKQK